MPPPSVPVKTPEGQAELSQRTLRLSQRHRTVLLLVDGRRSMGQVQGMAQQAGVPQSCVDELMRLGLIVMSQPTVPLPRAAEATSPRPMEVDLALDVPAPTAADADAPDDSELPASRTLQPESVFTDSKQGEFAAVDSRLTGLASTGPDEALEEARDILLRAVRAEAPVTGSLTLLRLRRAASRADLEDLLDEVEARISKPQRSLAAGQTLQRVRQLLNGRRDSALSTF